MPLMAYGEKLYADGRPESFLLTEELVGYRELQDFIRRRFPGEKIPHSDPLPKRDRRVGPDRVASAGPRRSLESALLKKTMVGRACWGRACPTLRLPAPRSASPAPCPAAIDRPSGRHRPAVSCSRVQSPRFLLLPLPTKETSPGQFDVRLIDLQRVQRRRWFRRRWIVKDLAQLAACRPTTASAAAKRSSFCGVTWACGSYGRRTSGWSATSVRNYRRIRRRERRKP